ncbi:hypothetical protein UGMREWDR_CDS0100 [Aeromonas phage GomatiRiver_11]|nr:hypothetical protein OBDJBBDK_00093 [Aeromonas phage AhFM11]WKW84267.1 hypothetical protein UGMREWDR_CDS0100 [Aeromonas phage GomatiRiver_11]
MIYWLNAAECAERLGQVVFPALRGKGIDILKIVFKNDLPSMMKQVVYQLAVHEDEIHAYLELTEQKVKLLREDQELLFEACRQLDRTGFLPIRP